MKSVGFMGETSNDKKKDDRWQRAVDRQYCFFGATLGLIIAAVAIIASPIAEGRTHPSCFERILITVTTICTASSILFLIRMVHVERTIAFYGFNEKLQKEENKLRCCVEWLLSLTTISVTILLVLRIWAVA